MSFAHSSPTPSTSTLIAPILRIDPGRVQVADLDLLDGTPILDIKPYVPEFDARLDVRIGWYAYAAYKEQPVVADERFIGGTS